MVEWRVSNLCFCAFARKCFQKMEENDDVIVGEVLAPEEAEQQVLFVVLDDLTTVDEARLTNLDVITSDDPAFPLCSAIKWRCETSTQFHNDLLNFYTFLRCFHPKYRSSHPLFPTHLPEEVLRIIHKFLLPSRNISLTLLLRIPITYPETPPELKVEESNMMHSYQLQRLLDDSQYYNYHKSNWEERSEKAKLSRLLLEIEENLHKESIEMNCKVLNGVNNIYQTITMHVNPFQWKLQDFVEEISKRIGERLTIRPNFRRVFLPNKSLYKNGFWRYREDIEFFI